MQVDKNKIINVSKDAPLQEGCFRPADKAKKNCKRCYGTGICGENLSNKAVIICQCVLKKIREEEKNEKQLGKKTSRKPWGLFKKMRI